MATMAKESLVLELQEDCLGTDTSTLAVLRKALVVARKLGVSDLREWIQLELNGYGRADEIPKYRIVSGQLKAWNPYQGWIGVIFKDSDVATMLSKSHFTSRVSPRKAS
jgi:AbiTii